MLSPYDRSKKKQRWIATVLVVLGILALVAAVWVLRNWRGTVKIEEEPQEAKQVEGSFDGVAIDESLYSKEELLSRILRRHFDAVSSGQGMDKLTSIITQGKIDVSGDTTSFQLIKKQPQMSRVRFEFEDRNVIIGYTGDDLWRAIYALGKLQQVDTPDRESLANFVEDSSLYNSLYLGFRDDWEMEYLGMTDYRLRSVYEIKVIHPRKGLMLIYVDRANFFVLKEVIQDPKTESSSTIIEYFDFEESGDFIFPLTVRMQSGSGKLQTLVFEEIQVNPGLLDRAFDKPSL